MTAAAVLSQAMTELNGAVALVTGAAGGIGSALCAALRGAGATVTGADLTNADHLLDVTDADAVARLVSQVVAEHGRLDVLVAAAGVGVAGPVEELALDDWRRVIEVNLWGTVNVVRSAYEVMVRQRSGHVVVVSSLSGLVPTPLLVPYGTSKSAVVGLAAGLRPEAARHGIQVTTVCPGPVDTAMLDDDRAAHGLDVRTYLTDAAGRAMSPTGLADAIVKAVRRDKRLVTPGRAGSVHRLARYAPGLVERLTAKAMSRALTRRDG